MATEKLMLKIAGMQCEHCRKSVAEAIKAVPGVKEVSVDLAGGVATAIFEPGAASPEAIRKAVQTAGYTVKI